MTDEQLRRAYLIMELSMGVVTAVLMLYMLTPARVKDEIRTEVRRLVVPYRRAKRRKADLARLHVEVFQVAGILDDYDRHGDAARLAKDLGQVLAP